MPCDVHDSDNAAGRSHDNANANANDKGGPCDKKGQLDNARVAVMVPLPRARVTLSLRWTCWKRGRARVTTPADPWVHESIVRPPRYFALRMNVKCI